MEGENRRVRYLPIRLIHFQPRRPADTAELRELAVSVERYGMLHPLTVRDGDGGYELVTGERRLRAAQLAGWKQVPCILVSQREEASSLSALICRIREESDYLRQAEALEELIRNFGLRQTEAAARVGMSQSAVANKLRLLRHSPAVREKLRECGLSERHARAFLRLPTEEERLKAIKYAAEHRLNAAKTEEYVAACLSREAEEGGDETGQLLARVEAALTQVCGGKIAFSRQEETEKEVVLTVRLSKTALQREKHGKP